MNNQDKDPKVPEDAKRSDFFLDEGLNEEQTQLLQWLRSMMSSGADFSTHLVMDYVKVLIEHRKNFNQETSDPESPITMAKLENMVLESKKQVDDINIKMFVDDLNRLEKEKLIISQKKKNTARWE
ncbi:MAG: hypothetical protein LBE38_10585 [Deltaproteobacteria bacterium]|jgi:hypothetical protein|nr:hypothetical protein [Deltaproteobacteria bacterium]